MPAQPPPLPENAGLAFIGEMAWAPAHLTASQTESLLAARNPTGRPNSDVLRSFVGKTGRRRHEHWQIDFPAHYHEQEAALHEKPFALLGQRIKTKSASWWINPRAQPPLRHALARLDRFLATALDTPDPAWTWFESDHLPDDSLLVVARDDDFTHAVLQSAAFTAWWRVHFKNAGPTHIIESFPFPWSPFTPLGALTRAQQDHRSAASRAGLAGDGGQIDSSVAAAYGWPDDLTSAEMLSALGQLQDHRLAAS